MLNAAVFGMLATFLPWVKVPLVGDISGTDGSDGWITFGLYLIPFIIVLIGDKTQRIKTKSVKFFLAIVPALLATAIGIYKIVDILSVLIDNVDSDDDNPFSQVFASGFSIEAGLYLVVLSGIVLTILAFAIKGKKASLPAQTILATQAEA